MKIDYTYDSLSRLLTANYDGGAVEYTYGYDLAGNLVNNNGTTRTYNAANQMVDDGTNTLTYDANGNLTNDGVNAYTWDRANRMLTAPGSASYKYDGLGNRIQQTVSATTLNYLNDIQPGLVKLLRQDDGSNVDHFVHAPRGIHAVDDGTDWAWYLQDGLGSVRGLVDVSADVVSSHGYNPIGVPDSDYGAGFWFTGEQTDWNDLIYLRARYMSPNMGTFLNLDPFEGVQNRPMSLNGYSWVEGNPVMNVDPAGMQLGSGNCGGRANVNIQPVHSRYIGIVEDQREAFLEVADRRRLELQNIIHQMLPTNTLYTIISQRTCLVNDTIDESIIDLLRPGTAHELHALFGIETREEFAARMATIPLVLNVSGWEQDYYFQSSAGIASLLQLTQGEFWGTQILGQADTRLGVRPIDTSSGFFELKDTEDEFRTLVYGETFDDLGIQTEGMGEIFEDSPRSYFQRYAYSPETGVVLAEVAGASLVRRYVEYLQLWYWGQPNFETREDVWRYLDPTAYAINCSKNGISCFRQGVGNIGEGGEGLYERYISHFRYTFDPEGDATQNRCLLRKSQVNWP